MSNKCAVWSMQVVSAATMDLISDLTAEKRRRNTSILIWIVSTILWNYKACRLAKITVYKFLSWTDWECHLNMTQRANKNKTVSITSSRPTTKTKISSSPTQSIKALLSPSYMPYGQKSWHSLQRTVGQDSWGCNKKLQSLHNEQFSSISLSALPHLTALL